MSRVTLDSPTIHLHKDSLLLQNQDLEIVSYMIKTNIFVAGIQKLIRFRLIKIVGFYNFIMIGLMKNMGCSW